MWGLVLNVLAWVVFVGLVVYVGVLIVKALRKYLRR